MVSTEGWWRYATINPLGRSDQLNCCHFSCEALSSCRHQWSCHKPNKIIYFSFAYFPPCDIRRQKKSYKLPDRFIESSHWGDWLKRMPVQPSVETRNLNNNEKPIFIETVCWQTIGSTLVRTLRGQPDLAVWQCHKSTWERGSTSSCSEWADTFVLFWSGPWKMAKEWVVFIAIESSGKRSPSTHLYCFLVWFSI